MSAVPAVYVYAVGREVPVEAFDGLTGVGGHGVRAVAGEGLYAVVGDVPADEFSEERLEASLQDLTWLAATARAHHHVVDTVGQVAALVPLALATVFHDERRVRAVLAERGPEFGRVLDDLDGRAEFGVKVYLPSRRDEPATGERPTSGAEYLRRRRAAVVDAERMVRTARESALALHGSASEASVRSRRHRVHDAALTGRSEQMVLNAAYLVDRARSGAWRAAIERAIPAGVTVEVTGPWIPYSFVEGGDGGGDTAVGATGEGA